MKKAKPKYSTNPLLFVRAPSVGQMSDPLKADWNQALETAAKDKPAQPDNIDLAELIDFSQMNAIFQNFLEVVGLPQAIIDFEGRVLASSNWQRLCMEFHRANPGTLQRCLESDKNLSREMREGKPYAIYRCRNGLTDCASPIVIEGRHIANLFIGQFLLAPPDPAYFEAQRAEFGFDKDAYQAALSEVPIISEERLPAILNLLTGLAHQIAMQSLAEHRAKLAYASVEHQVIERTAQLQASTELLQHVTSNVPGMVYQFRLRPDGSSCLPYASGGVSNIFHVTPEEVREDASEIFAKIHPDDYDATNASIQESAQDLTQWHHEFRVKFDDDTECWLLGDALPQREADGSTLWHGFITDITERKQAEEAIRRLNAELEQRVAQRTAQVEASNKELEEFSYSMSHDMRTPLRALDGFSKILLEEHATSLDDEGKRLLKVLRDNAQRMGRLIDDILHFLSMGRRRMEFSSVDIGKLAAEIVTGLQAAAPARRLRLEIGTLPPVWGDRDMLREVLQNLLSNAVKFSPGDGEVLIGIGGVTEEEENVYSVTDHGIGFDMRYADKLFKVFERVHPTGQYEGSGIGLALIKRIITRHKGRVWAEGKVNEGATLYFALPIKEKSYG
jgi:PAS domain S-box-containing protein